MHISEGRFGWVTTGGQLSTCLQSTARGTTGAAAVVGIMGQAIAVGTQLIILVILDHRLMAEAAEAEAITIILRITTTITHLLATITAGPVLQSSERSLVGRLRQLPSPWQPARPATRMLGPWRRKQRGSRILPVG